MLRERLALLVALVLTVLYAGAMAAALTGRAEAWSLALNRTGLHVVGGLIVAAIAVNLARRETPKP